ncbi:hypothetical protein [Lacticaseibacillus saniviri]
MHRQQRTHRKGWRIGLIIGLILIIVIGGYLLIRKGPNVNGPVEESASSSSQPATLQLRTYTASGSAADQTGNLRRLSVWVKLGKNHTYKRLMMFDRDTTPMVITDSGHFTQSTKQLKLTSDSVIVYGYANLTAYDDKTPNSIKKYGDASDSADFPESMQDVLNTRITLDGTTPDTYYYLKSRLPLKNSDQTVPSVASYAKDQELVSMTNSVSSSSESESMSSESTASESSASSAESSSSVSSSSSSTTDGYTPSADQIAAARAQLQSIGVNDQQWTDSQISAAIVESANKGGDSVIPILVPDYNGASQNIAANVGTGKIKYVDQAYAILLQQYPAAQYSSEQSGMTSDASGFIFTVRNRETGASKQVTVTGDGSVQG